MRVKKTMVLLLAMLLAVTMLSGCAVSQTMRLDEKGAGSYEETLTLTNEEWELLEIDESLFTQQGSGATLTDVTVDGVAGKQLKISMDFKSTADFQTKMLGMMGVAYNQNYFAMTPAYMPGMDDADGDDKDDDALFDMEELLEEMNADELAQYKDMLAMMEKAVIELRITFPYAVSDTNGDVQSDGKTVLWDTEKSRTLKRLYAIFQTPQTTKAPTFSGAKNGKYYRSALVVQVNSDTMLERVSVNKESTQSNLLTFSEEGTYRVAAKDASGKTAQLKFAIDMTKPTVAGVKNGASYRRKCTVKFSDKVSGVSKATLNGKKIKSGTKIAKKGSYTLRVTDYAGNTKTVKFKVK